MTELPESNRRDFLKGRSAFEAVRNKADEIDLELPSELTASESKDRQSAYVEQYAKNAMACEFELSFNMHQYRQAGAAAMAAFQLIDDLEQQMTIYRADSELSEINREAFQREIDFER